MNDITSLLPNPTLVVATAASTAVSRPDKPPATLADLIDEVARWADLPGPSLGVMASQIRQCATIAGRAAGFDKPVPAHIPCSVRWLNTRLFGQTPKMNGLASTSLSSAISGLRRALRRFDLIEPYRTPALPSGSAWRHYMDQLGDLEIAHGLRRFSWWCDISGIGPFDICQDAIFDFNEFAWTRLLHADIPGYLADVVSGLKKAATIIGSPQVTLSPPRRRQPYTIPFGAGAYPGSFEADVKLFGDHLARKTGQGPFSCDGPPKALRPSTVKARLFSLRQAASALVIMGRDPATITGLSDLIEEETFKSILWFFWRRTTELRKARGELGGGSEPLPEGGVSSQTAAIGTVLLMVAKYHVKCEQAIIKRLSALAADVRPPRQAFLSQRNRERLNALSVPINRAKLLHLPQTLMSLAEEIMRYGPVKPERMADAARLAMTAAAIEIELFCPLRIGNLTRLKFGVNLKRSDPRSGAFDLITVPPDEVKNNFLIEWPVGLESADLIELATERFRPLMGPPPTSQWVFPADEGGDGAVHVNTMRKWIVDAVAEHVGVRIHPHLFRAFVACMLLEAYPGALEDLRILLGHKTLETALAYYAYLNPKHVARRVDDVIRRARQTGGHVVQSHRLTTRPGKR